MSVEVIARGIIERQMGELAERIEVDLKSAVGSHSRTGLAVSAIHIEKRNEANYFIGGTDGTGKGITGTDHLAMLNDGNGGSNRVITSTRAVDRRGRRPGKLAVMDGMYTTFRSSVHGYDGIHFVEKVAAKYR